jgi:hypothetical protein
MTRVVNDIDRLYRVRAGVVDIVDVPELGYAMVDGAGAPTDPDFAAAVQALYSASYGVHFALRKEHGEAPRVRPLEALWWVDDPPFEAGTTGAAGVFTAGGDQSRWRWRALIVQPDEVDEELMARCVEQARRDRDLPAIDKLRYVRWAEGRCAQVLHTGPYSEEGPSLVRLHEGIAAAGYLPRGRHHELYLGDPRRSAPERLRTILRQPILRTTEPTAGHQRSVGSSP